MKKIDLNRLKNKKSIVFLLVMGALSLLIGVGMFWPAKDVAYYYPKTDDLVNSMGVNSKTPCKHMEILDDGSLLIDEKDNKRAYFELEDIKVSSQTLAIGLATPTEGAVHVEVEADYGHGFKPNRKASVDPFRGSDWICISLPRGDYRALRIYVDQNIKINSIEFHAKKPDLVSRPYPKSKLRILVGLVAGSCLWILFLLAEYFWLISGRIVDLVTRNKKLLLQDLAAGLVIAVLLLVDWFILKGMVGIVHLFFVLMIIYSIFVLIRNTFYYDLPVERTFFALSMIAGLAMIICSPVTVFSWDEHIHYFESVKSSALFGSVGLTDADLTFIGHDKKLLVSDYFTSIANVNGADTYITSATDSHLLLHRLPVGAVLALSRLLHVSYFWRHNLGRLAQLFIYSLCGYFGIKRLHSGKMLYSFIASFPGILFLATNYSYDYWVMCFLMLGMAYFVGMCQEMDEPVKYKDVIIMCIALVLGCLPKQIYLPIIVFPFLLATSKIKDKKWKYYAMCAGAFVIVFISFYLKSTQQMASPGDVRGGASVGPADQLANIMANPLWYAGVLGKFILRYLNPHLSPGYTFFAYLNHAPGSALILVMMILIAITDRNDYDKKAYPILTRVYALPYFFGMIALMATSMYLAFTPVGSNHIEGCQPRYMFPILYPTLALLFGGGLPIKGLNKKYYNTVIFVLEYAVCYFAIFTLMLSKIKY